MRAGGRAIVLTQGGRLADRVTEAGGELVDFPAATKNPARIWLNGNAIANIVTREGVDLIHARSRAPAWSARFAARATRKPFVTTYHGAYGEKNAMKRVYNRVMADGDIVIANSKYTRDLMRSRYDTPEGRIRVIYRGVDGDDFDAAAIPAERTEALRRTWGVGADARVILQAARLTEWKGQSVLIAATKLLHQLGRLGDAVVVLAGDAQGRDGYETQIRQEIAGAGLGGRVLLVGHVADMPAAYSAAHLAIVASTQPEAFGRVGTESQIMGCPVIATAIGAPPETVLATPAVPEDQRTGWLVPPGDAVALSEAISDALALTPEERTSLGQRARAHVLGSFTLDAMKRQTLAVYDELLGTHMAQTFDAAHR